MVKYTDIQAVETSRVLLYGPPKTGKSQLASELAEHFNLLWIDLENGHEVIKKLPSEWQERVEMVRLPDTRSFPIGIETTKKLVRGPCTVCDTHGKVSCPICKKDPEALQTFVDLNSLDNSWVVVLDSLTQLSNSTISFLTKNESDDYKLEFDDYGNQGKHLDIVLSHFQQAKYNVLCTSHCIEASTENKKSMLVPITGTRNVSRNVAKYFSHVVYCEKKNRKHTFSSCSTYNTGILTGSRTDICLEDMDKPSLLPFFKPSLYSREELGLITRTGTAGKEPAGTVSAKALKKPAGKVALAAKGGVNAASILSKLKK